jgi:uncharacterized membrane protein
MLIHGHSSPPTLALFALVLLLVLVVTLSARLWRSFASLSSLPEAQRERKIKHYWIAVIGVITGQLVVILTMHPSSAYRIGVLIQAAIAGVGYMYWLLFSQG